ncbi:hypothetical protein IFM89_007731 [Coptis chinensis]|uniref:Peptidyl-prolyl cis-trans isomerase n=1 Tax=Coptis chinensis TaxID=261450 RepID=A0A835IVL4_9MAGN|nr:hypothetical protein IFM89_007731 [Coptis chinensis]
MKHLSLTQVGSDDAGVKKVPKEGWTMQDGTPWPGNNVRDHPGMIQATGFFSIFIFLLTSGCFDILPDESFTLKHDGRGYPSMSNTGPNSNNSQFFITFRAVHHLDGLHVVFGKLVQGRRTLKKIESAGSKQGEPAFFVKIVNCGELLEEKENLRSLQEEGGGKDEDILVLSQIVHLILVRSSHHAISYGMVFLGQDSVCDVEGNELPRLVYVSREKKPGFDHHKKAGQCMLGKNEF